NAGALSGRLTARTAHATRESLSDQAVGGRARERAGQTDRTRGRDLCPRSQSRPARQGAIDASAPVEKTDQASARTATTRPDARRTIAQTRRGQEGGREGLYAAGHPHAGEGSAGHIRNIPLRAGPEEITAGAAARRQLFAALQYQERRSRPSVAALSAIGRGRASVQGVEERSVDPSDLSPARNPNRSPYFHCVSGLLSAGHAETAAEDAGAGIDGEGRARKTRHDADDRCRTAHHGRSAWRRSTRSVGEAGVVMLRHTKTSVMVASHHCPATSSRAMAAFASTHFSRSHRSAAAARASARANLAPGRR